MLCVAAGQQTLQPQHKGWVPGNTLIASLAPDSVYASDATAPPFVQHARLHTLHRYNVACCLHMLCVVTPTLNSTLGVASILTEDCAQAVFKGACRGALTTHTHTYVLTDKPTCTFQGFQHAPHGYAA